MRSIGVRLSLVLAVLGASTQASAQPADKAAAEALFVEARQLASEGKYEQACPKFAESQQLDPATGTLLNLADCYEQAGKTASAWMTWIEAASEAKARGQTDRERMARQRSTALQPRLVYLTIDVPESSQVDGMSVTRNGEPVREALWGTSVPVDPDRYTVAASAPGHKSWQVDVAVTPGQSPAEITVPPLQPDAADTTPGSPVPAPTPTPTSTSQPASPAAAPPPPAAAPMTAAPPQTDQPHRGSAQKTAGWILGGVGVVGIGVGSYFGVQTYSKNDDSMQYCTTDTLCTQEGADLRDEAKTSGNISTVSFGVGAAALVTGVVLIATGSRRPRPQAQGLRGISASLDVDRAGGQFVLKGGF